MKFLFLLLVAISSAYAQIRVVTTFSVLTDFVKIIGGDDVAVTTIVPLKSDPHTYQPTPTDVRAIANADLVIINGLGFEGWIERLIAASGYKGRVITAAEDVKPRTLMQKGVPTYDPHTWHDVQNAVLYVKTITKALVTHRPCKAGDIQKRSDAYQRELIDLDGWVRSMLNKIPQDKRLVVTTHDAFWYFGQAYNVIFLSPVGISTDAEPSAASVARLIKMIKREKIQAVFIENLSSKRLIEQISKETGVAIDGTLYADSLADGNAQSYIATVKLNTQTIANGFFS